jgi:HAD superfamily hydrolase (TIGR01450 family)
MTVVPQTSIEHLIDGYDALLFDAYGVLVHLRGALPGAPELIALLNRMRKPYYLVSNDASKLPETASARFARFGLQVPADRIITSGLLLRDYFSQQRLDGIQCAVLGPADSARYVELAGGEVVPADADFEALVIGDETGFPFLETVDTAMTTLFHRIDSGRPVDLILPNPDIIYPRGEHSFGVAAGGVALLFEAALRRRYPDRKDLSFVRLGKPEPHLYEEGIRRCGTRNVVMVGDQLETDIRGAKSCNIDAVLVNTGVSVADLSQIDVALRPTYWMKSVAPAGYVMKASELADIDHLQIPAEK